MKIKLKIILVVLAAIIITTGCNPWLGSDQTTMGQPLLDVTKNISLGQTFTAEFNGLHKIEFYLVPNGIASDSVVLTVFSSPTDLIPVAVGKIPSESIQKEGMYGFTLEPVAGHKLTVKDYYFKVAISGQSKYVTPAGKGDSYLNGSAYQDDVPLTDTQLVFRLGYDPLAAAKGLLLESFEWLLLLGIALSLFCLPGWGLFSVLLPNWKTEPWPSKLGLSIGFSLAWYPIFILFSSLLGLTLGKWYALVSIIAGIALIIWNNRQNFFGSRVSLNIKFIFADLVFVCIVLLIFWVRFYQVRLLPAPLWWDGYHHTVIAQLILDHGGVPNSWEPYAELNSLTYHFGFHSAAAIFSWITGLDAPQAVLWFGQIINGFAAIALYPLTIKISRSRWAGVVAVLFAGLLIPLLAFYVNWATYTLAAGLTILPLALYLIWILITSEKWDKGTTILLALTLAGLALTHYRVLIYAILFSLAFFFVELRKGRIVASVSRLAIVWAGAAFLFMPWLIRLLHEPISTNMVRTVTTKPVATSLWWLEVYNAIGPVTNYMPILFWILFAAAAAWMTWKGNRLGIGLIFGSLLVLLAANPQWFNLPGSGLLKNFSVFIGIYLPTSILVGAAIGSFTRSRQHDLNKWLEVGLSILFLGLAALGMSSIKDDAQPKMYSVLARPDILAAQWIQENTPQDAKFLVNSIFTYGGTSLAGTDGGMWLALLAGRQTTQPPIPYPTESSTRVDHVKYINSLAALIFEHGVTSEIVRQELFVRGIEYVYIGQRNGMAGNWENEIFLDPDELIPSPYFDLIYHQSRTWVFRIAQ